MHAIGYVGLLQLKQVVLDLLYGLLGHFLPKEIPVQPEFLDPIHNPPKLLLGELNTPSGRLVVVIYQDRELTVLPIGPSLLHGRNEVIDDHPSSSPLGLHPFANVVHDVRVEIGQILDQHLRRAGLAEPRLFAGEPFVGAVRSQRDDSIGLELTLQPEVEGRVLVVRPELRGMIQLHRVVTPAPWRLGDQDDIAQVHVRNDDLPVLHHDRGVVRLPPFCLKPLPVRLVQVRMPPQILVQRQANDSSLANELVKLAGSPRANVASAAEHLLLDRIL